MVIPVFFCIHLVHSSSNGLATVIPNENDHKAWGPNVKSLHRSATFGKGSMFLYSCWAKAFFDLLLSELDEGSRNPWNLEKTEVISWFPVSVFPSSKFIQLPTSIPWTVKFMEFQASFPDYVLAEINRAGFVNPTHGELSWAKPTARGSPLIFAEVPHFAKKHTATPGIRQNCIKNMGNHD